MKPESYFDAFHSDTADLHYEGRSSAGSIIIDAANIPFPFGRGYEVMVMTPQGKEIECIPCATLEEARIAYQKMYMKYVRRKE